MSTSAADATLTEQLIGILGRPVKEIEPVLDAAGLPVATKNETYAVASAGLSYHATPNPSAPPGTKKKELVVTKVAFHGEGDELYVRAEDAALTFAAYRGPLPNGIAWGDTAEALIAKLGEPSNPVNDTMNWRDLHEAALLTVALGPKGAQTVVLWLKKKR